NNAGEPHPDPRASKDGVAIVTEATPIGDGMPIGRAAAITLGRGGAAVSCVGGTSEYVERTVETIERHGGRVICVTADVRQENDCRRAVAEAVAEYGGLDFLDNNVGSERKCRQRRRHAD